METGAQISDCGKYRYALWRIWDTELPLLLFVGLNPSTANASEDDPTVRRCIGFAKQWKMGGILIGNLFAFRSTDPGNLMTVSDPIGSDNDSALVDLRNRAQIAVAIWGSNGTIMNRSTSVRRLLGRLKCLAVNKDGEPRHVLYIPYETTLKEYDAEQSPAECLHRVNGKSAKK